MSDKQQVDPKVRKRIREGLAAGSSIVDVCRSVSQAYELEAIVVLEAICEVADTTGREMADPTLRQLEVWTTVQRIKRRAQSDDPSALRCDLALLEIFGAKDQDDEGLRRYRRLVSKAKR